MKTLKYNIKIILGIIALVIFAIGVYFNNVKLNLELKGEKEITLEYGEKYQEKGTKGSIQYPFFKSKIKNASIIGDVDETTLGDYIVEYQLGTIFKKKTLSRVIHIVDTTAPEITLVVDENHYTKVNESYEEDGFKAIDLYDGDITEKVERVEKDGIVTYKVKDSSGNETTVTREILYEDLVPPTIQLAGNANMLIYVGGTYKEPGYSASDDRDGDLTNQISVEGNVNCNQVGTYILTYRVKDKFGNETIKERKVNVQNKPVVVKPSNTIATGNKIVYLTFDDGPGPYTQQLLDILAKYNVKVTFFVTAQSPKYLSLITKEVAAGHTVAVHSYTHDYRKIYSSVANYYADLKKMQDIIVQYGGPRTTLFRFPGGSSNKVSAQYCKGIMTDLTASLQNDGYHYFDWNVTSGDAGNTTSTQQIVSNIINGISSKNVSVVLQHDIKAYSVAAVEQVIVWGLNNGYTFKALQEDSFGAHHKVNN